MKYSQRIGILAAVVILALCFLPWSFIPSRQITVTGVSAIGTNFGKPGLMNIAMCVLMLVMFAVPALWAKRTNVFAAAINLAWSVRNYILVSTCMMGECPEKKIALYLLVVFSVVTQLMALLAKVPAAEK